MSEKQDLQVREICLEVLLPVFRGEEFSHVLIKGVLDKNDDWEGAKKAFFKKLTMGVIERKIELDYCIGRFCSHPVNKLKPVIRAILEMGAYQILYMDQVYDTKACNLSVELAKKKGCSTCKHCVHVREFPDYVTGEECECSAGLECDTVLFSVKNCPEWIDGYEELL